MRLGCTERKRIKTRGIFPNDEAVIKPINMAIRIAGQTAKRSACHWATVMNQFAILFGDRLTPSVN